MQTGGRSGMLIDDFPSARQRIVIAIMHTGLTVAYNSGSQTSLGLRES